MTGLRIIDDDIELSRLLAEYFESHGFAVKTANGGAQGLALSTSGQREATTPYLTFPEMGGCEVLRRLRVVSDFMAPAM